MTSYEDFSGRLTFANPDSISFLSDPLHDAIVLDPRHHFLVGRPDPKPSPHCDCSDRPNSVHTIGSAYFKDPNMPDLTGLDPSVAPFDLIPSAKPIPYLTGADVTLPGVSPTSPTSAFALLPSNASGPDPRMSMPMRSHSCVRSIPH